MLPIGDKLSPAQRDGILQRCRIERQKVIYKPFNDTFLQSFLAMRVYQLRAILLVRRRAFFGRLYNVFAGKRHNAPRMV